MENFGFPSHRSRIMDDRHDYDQNADYEFFVKRLPALLDRHEGQVALINQKKIVDYFDTMEAAVKAGMEKFGPERFIAQEIVTDDSVPISLSLAY